MNGQEVKNSVAKGRVPQSRVGRFAEKRELKGLQTRHKAMLSWEDIPVMGCHDGKFHYPHNLKFWEKRTSTDEFGPIL